MNTNFHTESRMRENCTYGSMRGRAYPTRGVPLYSTPFSVPNWGSAGCIDIKEGDAKLNEFLSGLCDCYIPVKVNYAVNQNKLSEREITWHYTIAPYGVPFIR